MKTNAAIVRDADSVVTNVIIVDDEALPSAPADHTLVIGADGMAIGGTYDPGTMTFARPPEPPEPPLPEVKAEASTRVDDEAEAARSQWITKGDGQSLVYEAKRTEAEAWAIAGSPRSLEDYPFMRARAARLSGVSTTDATEAQMQSVADAWSTKIARWKEAGSAIEGVREQAKEDIAAATDTAAVQLVLDDLNWPA